MWILPTMSRPSQCAEVLDRIRETDASTPGILFINGPEYAEEYKALCTLPPNWKCYVHPQNVGCIGALNMVFDAYPNEPFYGFIGDDEFLMDGTPKDWDKRLIAAAGDWNYSHGWEDLNNGYRAQGYLCIGGKLARAVGCMAIRECWHWFGLDCMWEWLSCKQTFGGPEACKKILVKEIIVDHRHAYAGKTDLDHCYELGKSRSEEDRKIFVDWQREEMFDTEKRIKKARENDAQ